VFLSCGDFWKSFLLIGNVSPLAFRLPILIGFVNGATCRVEYSQAGLDCCEVETNVVRFFYHDSRPVLADCDTLANASTVSAIKSWYFAASLGHSSSTGTRAAMLSPLLPPLAAPTVRNEGKRRPETIALDAGRQRFSVSNTSGFM
jgi:hypothetical protein